MVFAQAGRIVMPRPGTTPHSKSLSERDDSARMSGNSAEPELAFLNRDSVAAPSDSELCHSTYFQEWHRPYVEALEAMMDGDPSRVHEAVIRAQRAILNRYLELTAALESRPDEAEALATAVEVLQAMKRQTRTQVY
jgi:hypothetical protein